MELSENDLKIYVVTHKKFDFKATPYYVPIQVNAEKNEHFLNVTDDTGDNISIKNDRFCELTALYWIWKNDHESKYVGLCHYRRYFDFNPTIHSGGKPEYKVSQIPYEEIQFTPEVLSCLKNRDIIVPKKNVFRKGYSRRHLISYLTKLSVRDQYIKCHREEDLRVLENVLLEEFPDYAEAWKKVMDGASLHICNMFVMKKSNFNDYAEWLFNILFKVEKQIPPIDDSYQNRVFGFMAERLFNVYLVHNRILIKEYPLFFIENG